MSSDLHLDITKNTEGTIPNNANETNNYIATAGVISSTGTGLGKRNAIISNKNNHYSQEHYSDSNDNRNSRLSTTQWIRNTTKNILPREIDVFGFYLEPKHFLIILVLSTLMLGAGGTIIFLLFLGIYTIFQNTSYSSSNKNGSTNNGRIGVRWSSGGKNVRGMKDLPKSPKGG